MDAQSSPRVAPQHDFLSKLRRPGSHHNLSRYIAWRQDVLKAQASGLPEPPMPELWPVSLNVDLTTACNYKCPHCIDLLHLNGRERHDHDELLSTMSFLVEKGLRSVILIGGGEPTVYRNFEGTVMFLKGLGLELGIVSNGSGNARIEKVAHALRAPDWVRLSLDSAKEETFNKMHLPKRGVTLEGICAGVPKIRAQNPDLSIGFSFIITWKGAKGAKQDEIVPNIDEIVDAARLARDSGFSYISLKPFLERFESGSEGVNEDAMDHYDETMDRIREMVQAAKQFEQPGFKVIESTNLTLLENGNAGSMRNQPRTCHVQVFRQVLTPDGIVNCPANRGKDPAVIADKSGFTNGFQESLAGMVAGFDAHRECRETTCLYNSANWAIEDAIAGKRTLEPLEGAGDHFL